MLDELYQSLNRRLRPEDVAQMIMELQQGRLDRTQERLLKRVAGGSLKQLLFGYTSMAQDFAQPIGLERQAAKASELFAHAASLTPQQTIGPEAVEAYIRDLSAEISKTFGQNDFRTDRLNHDARRITGLELSRRRYNKLFRHLTRMEAKLHTLIREQRKQQFAKIGKSSLAALLSHKEFISDLDTACFVAYYTARANLRSEFTVRGQQRAFDEIAAMLLARCQVNTQTNWFAIAHVYPSDEVLHHLSDAQKGELLGRWFAVLQDVADLLQETWDRSDINSRTMIVRRNNDSTTWNNTVSAWNKARDHWLALLHALEMDELLDTLCPGKALRLIAADVAAWHRAEGHPVDPDVAVWNDLPFPWQVLRGETTCTRPQIEQVCRKHGVSLVTSGWSAPRRHTAIAAYRPTPELVHGVTVSNPFLATVLKKAGYFSGTPKSSSVPSKSNLN